MSAWVRVGGVVGLCAALVLPAAARDVAPLVPFGSAEDVQRLARNAASPDFAALANQFEPQSNAAFCGPTSAAIDSAMTRLVAVAQQPIDEIRADLAAGWVRMPLATLVDGMRTIDTVENHGCVVVLPD